MKPLTPVVIPPIPNRTPEERKALGLDPEGTISPGGADFAGYEQRQYDSRPRPRN
jgi:hypothetical protein